MKTARHCLSSILIELKDLKHTNSVCKLQLVFVVIV